MAVDGTPDFLTGEEVEQIEDDPVLTVRDVLQWRRSRPEEGDDAR